MIYRLYKTLDSAIVDGAYTVDQQPGWGFLFVETEPRYQQFKQAINDDTAQLEDVDGNTMSAEDAKQFVSTLP